MSLSFVLAACGAASAPVVSPTRSAIENAETTVLAQLAGRLTGITIYRGEMRAFEDRAALRAAYPDYDEEEYADIVLVGPVVGTSNLDLAWPPRAIEVWSEDAYLIVGGEEHLELAAVYPYGTAGGVDARCERCVVEAGGDLTVDGDFVVDASDPASRRVEVHGALHVASLSALTEGERRVFVRALGESAFFQAVLSDDAEPELDGTWLVLRAHDLLSEDAADTTTHGCDDVVPYEVERRIDLSDPTRREARVLSVGARVRRCCPRDETGAPCSPGPRCETTPLE